MTIYLDCNATTPIEPEVVDVVLQYLRDEFGNAGSRTHVYGARAKQVVESARDQVASVVNASRDEVIFTSGATESNNLAILGLRDHATKSNKKHIVSTRIEHKAVLEPLASLQAQGFEISLVAPDGAGRIQASSVLEAVREDTLLVSVMHANNETGVIQPIEEIAALLPNDVFFHVDAAQTFGKLLPALRLSRIDLISVSGHKVYAPKGIGALICRRRNLSRPPLVPLMFGGGQERGIRPGTLPVHLIAGLGTAAHIALRDNEKRLKVCNQFKNEVLAAFGEIGGLINGDQDSCLPHVLNVSVPGVDSEAAIVALKNIIAVSNGSACTSSSYDPSHVLVAMGLAEERVESALRLSWCHITEHVDWSSVKQKLLQLM